MLASPGASDDAGGDGVDQGDDIALAIIWEGEDLLHGVNRP